MSPMCGHAVLDHELYLASPQRGLGSLPVYGGDRRRFHGCPSQILTGEAWPLGSCGTTRNLPDASARRSRSGPADDINRYLGA